MLLLVGGFFCDVYFLKYVWSAAGMLMVALPALSREADVGDPQSASNRTRVFTTSQHLLTRLIANLVLFCHEHHPLPNFLVHFASIIKQEKGFRFSFSFSFSFLFFFSHFN
jgi:hypothetical protein